MIKNLHKLFSAAWWWDKLCHNKVGQWIYFRHSLRISIAGPALLSAAPPRYIFAKNCISDFSFFLPFELWHDKAAKLYAAEQSLAAGNLSYTLVEEQVLLAEGWMNCGNQQAVFGSVDCCLEFGDLAVATLFSAYVHPQGRRRGIYRDLLQCRARDALSQHRMKYLLCAEEEGNELAMAAHDDVGFETLCLFEFRRVLGREKHRCLPQANSFGLFLQPIAANRWRLQSEPAKQ